MLPQKTQLMIINSCNGNNTIKFRIVIIDAFVFASHSYEAGVQGDNIPDNTHIDLSQVTLPPAGVFPLYDSGPNFVSGHFLYKGPCNPDTKVPLVSVIAGHIDELEGLTHVDFVPLYYVGHASPILCIYVYHAHIPDPLEGGSPRVTDIDLVNFSPNPVEFNPGDAVDVNVQRSLGNIGNYYEDDPLLPLELPNQPINNNPVIELNDGHEEEAAVADNPNVQKILDNLAQLISDN